jgi:predicted amidohydrolase
MARMAGSVALAAVRLAPHFGDVAGNRARGAAAVAEAAAGGAQLVVLPELATSGYCFEDAAEARALAEPIPGPTTEAWGAAAAAAGVVVVGGICELDADGAVRNTIVVLGPDGTLLARYRKLHLWGREKLSFLPGDEPPPVVETPVGRLGLGICFDLWFPEHVRALALAGAEIAVFPSNFSHSEPQDGLPHLDVVTAIAMAHVNRLHLVVSDRCGTERGQRWVGSAMVVDADGLLLGLAPDDDRPCAVHATVELTAARDKRWGAYNDVLADRRPGLDDAAVIAAPASSSRA